MGYPAMKNLVSPNARVYVRREDPAHDKSLRDGAGLQTGNPAMKNLASPNERGYVRRENPAHEKSLRDGAGLRPKSKI